jgi:hypothetical protein
MWVWAVFTIFTGVNAASIYKVRVTTDSLHFGATDRDNEHIKSITVAILGPARAANNLRQPVFLSVHPAHAGDIFENLAVIPMYTERETVRRLRHMAGVTS